MCVCVCVCISVCVHVLPGECYLKSLSQVNNIALFFCKLFKDSYKTKNKIINNLLLDVNVNVKGKSVAL